MAAHKQQHVLTGTAILGERGQVVVPIEARKKLGLKKGDSFVVMVHNDALVFLSKKKMADFVKRMAKELKI